MPRPAPKPFAQLAGAVFVIALLAWGLSYLPSSFHIESRRGQLFLIYSDGPIRYFDSSTPDFHGYESMISVMREQTDKNRRWHGLGFELLVGEWPKFLPDSGGGAMMIPFVVLIVPYWSVLGLAALLLLVALWRARRVRKLAHAGCCTACGYDLRFSRDRCPECGSVIVDPQREVAA